MKGGREPRRESYDFFSLPLWVRPNSVVPIGANSTRPDYDFADGVTFQVFNLEEGAAVSTTVPTLQGDRALTFHIRREEGTLDIQVEGAGKSWQVLLRGISAVTTISGGSTKSDTYGTVLLPGEGSDRLRVQL
jgi:alpha-D-xyloside xylohydrolase